MFLVIYMVYNILGPGTTYHAVNKKCSVDGSFFPILLKKGDVPLSPSLGRYGRLLTEPLLHTDRKVDNGSTIAS